MRKSEVQTLKKFFAKKLDETNIPEIKPILVFTNDEVELDTGDSPILAMKLKQLKEFLRQGAKNRTLTADQITELNEALEVSTLQITERKPRQTDQTINLALSHRTWKFSK